MRTTHIVSALLLAITLTGCLKTGEGAEGDVVTLWSLHGFKYEAELTLWRRIHFDFLLAEESELQEDCTFSTEAQVILTGIDKMFLHLPSDALGQKEMLKQRYHIGLEPGGCRVMGSMVAVSSVPTQN